MAISRIKQTKKNIIAAIINRALLLLFGFLARTVLINKLGAEYVGLSGLVTSILNILSLAELGFASAVTFNLYKPLAENDNEKVCAILSYFRKSYHTIGIAILTIGFILLPFLRFLIKGDPPSDINIHIVYIIYLINACSGYFFFSYVNVLLTANQRNDIDNYLATLTYFLEYGLQIIVLTLFSNYYVYILVVPVVTISMNLVRYKIVKRIFPQYSCIGELDKETKESVHENIRGLLVQKICSSTRNTFDSIFISSYIGLTMTGIYSNYFYISSTVHGILVVLCSAMSAGIGNSIAVETQEKNHRDMKRFVFIYAWVSGVCATCLICAYQPFMGVWAGETMKLPFLDVSLFVVYFYLCTIGDIRYQYSAGTGMWWKERYRSIAEVVGNIILNAVLGKLFGVTGIILATIITLFFINFIYGSTIIYNNYFTKFHVSEYYKEHGIFMGCVTLSCILSLSICTMIRFEGILNSLLCCICAFIVSNVLFFVLFCRTKIFKDTRDYVVHSVIKIQP